MSILEQLDDEQIVSFALADDNAFVEVLECCDKYFSKKLTREEFSQLIEELQSLLNKMPKAANPIEQEVVGFIVNSGLPGYHIVKRAAEPTSDSPMAMWRGKPVQELKRHELLEALSWCGREIMELREDRDKWRNAGDVKKYLLQK